MGRTEAKALTLLAALMCVGMLAVSPDVQDVCLLPGVSLRHRAAYMFCHANLLHLAMNLWALLYLVFLFPVDLWMLLTAALSAAAVPDALIGSEPVVGMSGAVFFLLGGIADTVKGKRRYLLSNLGFILLGTVLPHIAWGVHLWCFICGLIYAYGKCKVFNRGKQ